MKSESYTKPSIVDVVTSADGNAVIFLNENIVEIEKTIEPKQHKPHRRRDDSESVNVEARAEVLTAYVFDQYVLTMPDRPNIKEEIENNFDHYMNLAKKLDYDNAAKAVREERDKLLAEVDWTQMADTALPADKKEAYKSYRQELRDIPEQELFPYQVNYPVKP